MDKCFNKEVYKILRDAEKEMLNLKHPYVGTEHLLLALLKIERVKAICYKHALTYTNFRTFLLNIMGSASKKSANILYTPLLKIVIEGAYNRSYQDHEEMNERHLLASLLGETDGIALRIIDNMGIDTKEITKELNRPALVNELGVNLNDTVNDEKVLLREKELAEIMQILLRKNKNNPLLIGKAGVGKTAIVEELVRLIKKGEVPDQLKDKEIILINTASLIAGTKYRGEFEERVNNLIKEVINNKNIILFIDEIHNIIKTGASDGSIDAANILKPYLARGDLAIIGATTTDEFNEYIKKDAALTRRFTPIMVSEPSLLDMEYILTKIKPNFMKHYQLKIPKQTILTLIKESDLYLPNHSNPDKCIEILDTTCAKKMLGNYQKAGANIVVNSQDIITVIKERLNMQVIDPVKINNLKNELAPLHNEQIIKNVINIIRATGSGRHMILNGYEGREKEKVIKLVASKLAINLITIDCEEYNDEYSLNKLLGNNYLYNLLVDHPYSIVMFNNYQACHKIVYNLISTMINGGYITNNKNEKLNLNNAIIFLLNNTNQQGLGFNNKNKLLFAS